MKSKLIISGAVAALTIAAGGVAIAQAPGGPGLQGRGPGGMMMMADLNKDGNLTRGEATQAVKDRFAKMDVNRDGKLTREDRQLRRQQRQDAWFASADTDRNGQLSKAEFTTAREARFADRAERRGPDGEGRGFGRHHGGGFGKFHAGRGGFGPGRADADKDGAVTLAEMTSKAMAMFDRADTNKDGTVTAAERQATRDAMRAKWQERRAERGQAN